MLGVRRPNVTTALHVLEGNRFLKSERCVVIVKNRAAMEEFARAYGLPEQNTAASWTQWAELRSVSYGNPVTIMFV